MIQEIRNRFPYTFVVLILLILVFEYFVNVKLVWIDHSPSSTLRCKQDIVGTVIYLGVYHLSLFMLLWSLGKSMFSEPGKVPTYWGYFMNDPQNRRKIYCIMCHIFKPERTHHCRTCKKCVLNMDHHCPWINNCIGFYNRKFFILMLFYTALTCVLQAIGILVAIPAIVRDLNNEARAIKYLSDLFIVVALVLNMVILITILIFMKFHIELILSNTTTIETLQLKAGKQTAEPVNVAQQVTQYDIGKYYNWLQVFGKNYWHWPLPFYFDNQGPAGDGVIWPKKIEASEL